MKIRPITIYSRSSNQKMANWLDELDLSDDARHLIDNTDFSLYLEMFANCEDAQDVEDVCLDLLTYEEDGVRYRDTYEEYFAKTFETESGEELCNFTGRLVWEEDLYRWLPEFVDSKGGLHV